jgi:hypothetical protein
VAAAAIAALVVTQCGNDDEAVRQQLRDAFSKRVGNADMRLDAQLEVEGAPGITRPLRLKVEGPYRSGPEGQPPSYDWRIDFMGPGRPTTFRLVSDGKKAYTVVSGQAYEVSDAGPRPAEQTRADPSRWVVNGEEKGEETIDGQPMNHIAAELDLDRVVDDLNELAGRAGSIGGAGAPPSLDEEQRAQLKRVVKDPHFDVFIGRGDGRVHRISGRLRFDVPAENRQALGGATGGTLTFTLNFSNFGRARPVKAPENARPLRDLPTAGGIPDVGQGGGAGGGAAPGGGAPGGGAAPGGGTAPGGAQPPAGESPAPGFDAFGDCIRQAPPGDQQALERCRELIR